MEAACKVRLESGKRLCDAQQSGRNLGDVHWIIGFFSKFRGRPLNAAPLTPIHFIYGPKAHIKENIN